MGAVGIVAAATIVSIAVHRMKGRSQTAAGNSESTAAASPGSMTAALTEFQALRAEIVYHYTTSAQLMSVHLAALAAISAAVIQYHANVLLTLIVPLLSIALGFMTLHHTATLLDLGAYIRDHLWPFVRLCSDGSLPSWEEHWTEIGMLRLHERLVFNAGLEAVYVGPIVVALTVSFWPALSAGLLIWWIAEVALCVAVASYSAGVMLKQQARSRQRFSKCRQRGYRTRGGNQW
jgi:hypothetical protein